MQRFFIANKIINILFFRWRIVVGVFVQVLATFGLVQEKYDELDA